MRSTPTEAQRESGSSSHSGRQQRVFGAGPFICIRHYRTLYARLRLLSVQTIVNPSQLLPLSALRSRGRVSLSLALAQCREQCLRLCEGEGTCLLTAGQSTTYSLGFNADDVWRRVSASECTRDLSMYSLTRSWTLVATGALGRANPKPTPSSASVIEGCQRKICLRHMQERND